MSKQLTEPPQGILWFNMLKVLFANPCLILMLGDWRQGKTDTSLLIAYLALKWKLVHKVASNIYTFEDKRVRYITNLPRLKRWLHRDRKTKLFIFDEALAHIPSRTAMSRKNVAVMVLFSELSKGHGRMIFCSQSSKVDSSIKDLAFLRSVMTKLDKKVMQATSNLFPPLRFTGIPRSPIKFDKDRLAEFSEREGVVYNDLSFDYKVGTLFDQGLNFHKISKQTGEHPQKIKRALRKIVHSWLKNQKIDVVLEEAPPPKPLH